MIVIGLAKTTEEKEAIYKLRYQVYFQEMGKQIKADHERQMIVDELDGNGYLFFVKIESCIVGTVRLHIGMAEEFPRSIHDYFYMSRFEMYAPVRPLLSYSSRLILAPEYRHSWVLYRLLAEVYKFASERNVVFNFCYCVPHLVELYKRLGYRKYTKDVIYPEKSIYTPLVLVGDDIHYLKNVRSPLYRLANKLGKTHIQQTVDWFTWAFPQADPLIENRALS